MLASVVGEEWTEPGELLRLETGHSIREMGLYPETEDAGVEETRE